MDKLLALQKKLVPELVPLILSRHHVLRAIHFMQPIGRRALAEHLHLQERKIRNEVDLLKEQDLINIHSSGMQVTAEGEALLWALDDYIRELRGLHDLEQRVAERFRIKKVLIVPGDADRNPAVKKDLARVTADFLRQQLGEGAILAVTGGTTLAEVAGALSIPGVRKNVTVLPARGGLGEEVEIQANTVAANIAKGLGGNYRLLHVPDDLQQATLKSIVNEPKVRELLALLHRADIVLHGIGSAEEMSLRRGVPQDQIRELLKSGAVGEAFGYYFDNTGKVIHTTSSVGLQLADLGQVRLVVAVVGGKSKAEAVKAVLSHSPRDVVIIDEGAANAIVD